MYSKKYKSIISSEIKITEDFKDSVFCNPESVKIAKRFVRKCKNKDEYSNRLAYELDMIIKKKFTKYLFQVCDILDLVKDIPHITRGSSGSSLVCYLLGISNVDPVKENISFGRFLNHTRTSLPDFDLDFCSNKRDIVFERINKRWGEKVGRISNHIYYKEKSALRQAIRDQGIHKFIPKHKCSANLFPEKKKEILKRQEELIGSFRCYSLHCGGITFYKDGVPKELLLDTKTKNQIKYNKDDLEKNKKLKIDILSNRGLSQLYDISNKEINEYPDYDEKTINLLKSADNIGITFAESPVMKKTISVLKPKTIKDLAICLAIIRPAAASDGRKSRYMKDALRGEFNNYIIFDDDAIKYIKNKINCDEGTADQYRRAFAKKKQKDTLYFEAVINDFNDKDEIIDNLNQLRKYSFCKSHAYSYAQLVWALAYQKANNPKKFWESTLNNCRSMYRSWVHFSEAKKSGITLTLGKRPWKLKNDKLYGYGKDKNKGKVFKDRTSIDEYKLYGYWVSKEFLPNMYVKILDEKKYYVEFRGLIATGRQYYGNYVKNKNGSTFITIGYKTGHFIDITIDGLYKIGFWDVIKGKGYIKPYIEGSNYLTIAVSEHKFEKL